MSGGEFVAEAADRAVELLGEGWTMPAAGIRAAEEFDVPARDVLAELGRRSGAARRAARRRRLN